jgi:hypothetical protein
MREVPFIIYALQSSIKVSYLVGYIVLSCCNLLLLFMSIVTVVFFGVTIRLMKKEEYSQMETLNIKTKNLEKMGLKS